MIEVETTMRLYHTEIEQECIKHDSLILEGD